MDRLGRKKGDLAQKEALMMNDQMYLEKFKLLAGMAMLLQSCTDENELFDVAHAYLPRLFPGVYGEIFLQEENGQAVNLVFSWGTPAKEIPPPDFTLCRSFNCKLVVNVRENRGEGCKSCQRGDSCVPFCHGEHAFGMLCLTGGTKPLPVGYRGLTFVTAEYLALTISNLRLKNRLHELTIKDPLTGLFNRRYMERVIPLEFMRAKRAHTTLGGIMVDLDHFKSVNDTFGHDAGDAVLRKVGIFLNSMFRMEDVVCRFGGEEFFVLMTAGGPEDYCRKAQEVRGGIKALEISWKGRQISPITVSLGVAVFPDHAQTVDEMIKMADKALYVAKRQGRDRVVEATATLTDS